ncbi:hypothetical protein ABIC94_005275 [Variovorax paradoxus]|uniref:sulfotransferase family protein n=1 Tax=Variovorax paradoxus TaxID=34073 RepID=UPI003398B12D
MSRHQPMPVIVGAPRSGTTLLRLMLDAHPDLAIPPETTFVAAVSALTESHGDLRTRFLETITAYPPGAPNWQDFGLAREALAEAVQALEPFTLADGLRAFYRLYAQRFDKSRWGDKTPDYSLHMGAIAALLPEARFVHLVRDGRDVAASWRQQWFSPGHEPEVLARAWATRVEAARNAGAACAHYTEVFYEDLVTRPEPMLRRLCEFLELPWSDQLLNHHERAPKRLEEHRARVSLDGSFIVTHAQRLHQQHRTMERPGTGRIGSWRETMSGEEVQRFEGVAGSLLVQLGYELQGNG